VQPAGRRQSCINEANGFAAAAGIDQALPKLELGWRESRAIVIREAAETVGLA